MKTLKNSTVNVLIEYIHLARLAKHRHIDVRVLSIVTGVNGDAFKKYIQTCSWRRAAKKVVCNLLSRNRGIPSGEVPAAKCQLLRSASWA